MKPTLIIGAVPVPLAVRTLPQGISRRIASSIPPSRRLAV
jgi:hypothetical protein